MGSRGGVPTGQALRELEQLAVAVAEEAGALVRDERPGRTVVDRAKSSDLDIVTVMDTRSEQLIRARLAAARPDDGVLGEEEGLVTGRSGLTWVVDPIDGTVNYLYEIPAYCVSVAAVLGDPSVDGAWRPVAGAVVNPLTGERYTAALGGGAWHRVGDGPAQRLTVADTSLDQALCGTGFGYDADRRAWQAAVLTHVLPRVRDIRRIGSAALDLCRVADGSLDVHYERGLNPWDMAAGWLVATEAGAVVTDLDGGHPRAGFTVAGPPAAQGSLRTLLRSAVEQVGPESAR
ncbi:MAG TPA: inositol monophosphatase [Janibacter terrae]|nr:inositol monophosphatase [Janibacter terrae]